MTKTQEELDELKNNCESLSAKLPELTEDELKEVTGGATKSSDIIFHSSYTCPFCGQKHTFDYYFESLHLIVSSFNACSKTKNVYLTGSGLVSIVDTDNITYKISYTTDSYTM